MRRVIVLSILVLFANPLAAKSIVVLGDSISASYGIDAEQGWVALLQAKVATVSQFYQIFNESISGDTTAGGLARIDEILAKFSPEIVVLELGANDGLRGLSLPTMKNNLAQIIKRSKKTGAQVLLLSMRIPPNYGKRYTEMFYQVYQELAHELDVIFVPFILQEVALAKELMQADGLHPNAKAQRIIADKVEHYLKPILTP